MFIFPLRARLIAASLGAAFLGSGCATYHEDLMSNQQLMAANCDSLSVEQRKVEDNAKHADEASNSGKVGSVFIAILEGVAAAQTHKPVSHTQSGAMVIAELSDEDQKLARELDERKSIIGTLRAKKGCV